MNQKAFTLFTALISFLLIMLSGVLVQSMINAESTTIDILGDAKEQVEIQAIADLARADAMQVFNYAMREVIETYYNDPGNYILLDVDDADYDWADFVTKFRREEFGSSGNWGPCSGGVCSGNTEQDCTEDDDCLYGSSQFAHMTAGALMGIIDTGERTFGIYVLKLDGEQDKLVDATQKMLIASANDGEFLEVVGGDSCARASESMAAYEDCIGTFYVTLDTKAISPEDYESLPQIVVKNMRTGRVIREPILPRGKFKIYIPIRIFKAIAAAKWFASEVLYTGVLDTVKRYKVGYCWDGCANNGGNAMPSILDDLRTPPREQNMCNYLCDMDSGPDEYMKGEFTITVDEDEYLFDLSNPSANTGSLSYIAKGVAAGRMVDSGFVRKLVDGEMGAASNEDGFVLVNETGTEDYEAVEDDSDALSKLAVEINIVTTKTIISAGGNDAWKLNQPEPGKCVRVEGISGEIIFQEQNPNYRVRNKETGKFNTYRIRLSASTGLATPPVPQPTCYAFIECGSGSPFGSPTGGPCSGAPVEEQNCISGSEGMTESALEGACP